MPLPSKGDVLVSGRFLVVRAGLGSPVLAEDREEGGLVEVVQSDVGLLDRVALEEMLTRAHALGDARLVLALTTHPVCIPYEADDPTPASGTAELADAALDLLEVVGLALAARVEVDPRRAWLGSSGVRLPAPAPALYWRRWAVEGAGPELFMAGVWEWYRRRRAAMEPRVELPREWDGSRVGELAARFAAECSNRALGEARARALAEWHRFDPPRPDLDRVIELGEALFARVGSSEPAIDYEPPPADFVLAAAYHHRACVAWAEGRKDAARSDVSRACAIDPYPRYLTTAALFEEGDVAAGLHDRAVAAILEAHEDPFLDGGNLRERVDARDAARTLHARGVHRLRAGDHEAGVHDLRESLRHLSDPRVEAALERAQARSRG
ncbi:MAG: hypothetical protein VYE22_31830 [Myxococcota bacterium]|nr:hypothetical protein [Myxococcota bacterium]